MSAPDPFALGGEPDDDKAFAALEFEPIDNADLIADLTQPAYGKMWFGLGVPLRLAATIVGMTKPELIEATGKILAEEAHDGDPPFERLMNSLRDTAERLKALAELCAAAEARSLVAASCFALALPEDAEPPTTG